MVERESLGQIHGLSWSSTTSRASLGCLKNLAIMPMNCQCEVGRDINGEGEGGVPVIDLHWCLSAPKSQQFCDLRVRCPSRTPEIAAISETRELGGGAQPPPCGSPRRGRVSGEGVCYVERPCFGLLSDLCSSGVCFVICGLVR